MPRSRTASSGTGMIPATASVLRTSQTVKIISSSSSLTRDLRNGLVRRRPANRRTARYLRRVFCVFRMKCSTTIAFLEWIVMRMEVVVMQGKQKVCHGHRGRGSRSEERADEERVANEVIEICALRN